MHNGLQSGIDDQYDDIHSHPWSDDTENEDDAFFPTGNYVIKRHLGPALNTKYGTWHYRPSYSSKRMSALYENGLTDPRKRARNDRGSVQDALDWLQDGGNVDDNEMKTDEKRRLGSALNTRYGTWHYRRPGVSFSPDRNSIRDRSSREVSKRFLGPALDVRYRHFGSPFYRIPGTWSSMKRPFPKLQRPLWSGRMKRATDDVDIDSSAENDMEDSGENNEVSEESDTAEIEHENLPAGTSGHQNGRVKQKRHLGAALGQGYGSFHVNRYRPSMYKMGKVYDDKKAEARMVKLMG